MSAPSREHLGWVVHEYGPQGADQTVLLLPGALATALFYDDLLAEPEVLDGAIRFVATTLPGFGGTPAPDDLSMENYARLAGRLAADHEDRALQTIAMEIDYGPFQRDIRLPADIKIANVHADQRNGTLWIHLPLKKT